MYTDATDEVVYWDRLAFAGEVSSPGVDVSSRFLRGGVRHEFAK